MKNSPMIRITVELLKFGEEDEKKLLGVMEISNDASGNVNIGNYKFKISKFGGKGVWKQGRLEDFDRINKGPWDLLYLALRSAVGNRNGSIWEALLDFPKMAVVGSRTVDDKAKIFLEIDKERKEIEKLGDDSLLMVSGGASGPDSIAQEYAKEHGLPILIIYPDWKTFGKKAGPVRNEAIAQICTRMLAFWDKKSKGTRNVIDTAKQLGRRVRVIKEK